MQVGLTVIVISLIYSILVSIVYFSKKRVNTTENKLYSILMRLNIFGLILEILCCFFVYFHKKSSIFAFFNVVSNKLFLVYLLTWLIVFTVYVFFISFCRKESFKEKIMQNKRRIYSFLAIVYLIILTLVSLLPLYYFNDGVYVYSYGPATNILFYFGVICIVFSFFCIFKNLNTIRIKEYYPLFLLVFLMSLAAIIRYFNPGLIIINSCFSFITVLTYFTIENPDVQTIDLLVRNRELVEQSVNDRSNFLFKISQDLKKPIQSSLKEIKLLKNPDNKEESEIILDSLENNLNSAFFMINDVTNISSMDVKSFKVQENTYMMDRFISDINANVNNRLKIENKDQKIQFNFKINSSYPESLYGDYIKLKQVLLSIINNSIKYTQEGFIDVELDALTRYDACKLIFTISDSGCGISLNKVNKLLSVNEELSESDFQKTDNLNLRLPVINKLLKVLGGNMNINSKEGSGTVVTVVINQEVNYDSTNLVFKNIKKYNNNIQNKKRIFLADDDTSNLDKIDRLLSKYDVEVVSSLVGREIIDKINAGDLFDLILLKDQMNPDNAYTIFNKLKDNKKFNIPVVIMINKDKEFIKKHFTDDGFSDCIVYDNLENDLKKICEKYI